MIYLKKPNTYGGGAKTNENGLTFEQVTSLDDALKNAGYHVIKSKVVYNKNIVGFSVAKHKLYKDFLNKYDIDYTQYNSKKWLPDECFINTNTKTVYVIEKKFQNRSGSVDEKLPGCQFKKMEYEKLFTPLGYTVEFAYVFNDWFLRPEYRDVLEYIKKTECYYFFNKIPLKFLGL